MSWVAAAIGGSALIGAGASYFSSKNQSEAANKALLSLYRDLKIGRAHV